MHVLCVSAILAVLPLTLAKVVFIPSVESEAPNIILDIISAKLDPYLEEQFAERSLSSAYTASRLTRNLEAYLGSNTRFTVNEAYKFILDQIGVISNDEMDRSGKSLTKELMKGFLSFARIFRQLDADKVGRSGGYGGGGGGYGYDSGGYIDPYVVLGALGFGTFLFNIIYNILNSSGRSVDVDDLSVPLELSDVPESITGLISDAYDRYESSDRKFRPTRLEDLYQFIEEAKMAYDLSVTQPKCLKSFACRLISGINMIDSQNSDEMADMALDILFTGLAKVFNDETVATFARSLRSKGKKTDPVECQNAVNTCDLDNNIM